MSNEMCKTSIGAQNLREMSKKEVLQSRNKHTAHGSRTGHLKLNIMSTQSLLIHTLFCSPVAVCGEGKKNLNLCSHSMAV